MTWSFEGTRSRTGKLMPPRYGLLKYVLEAAHVTGARDIHVIPVAVSYDLMRDVEDYASEQAGRLKQSESLTWFVKYLSSLRRPMGRMYLNFGQPVVLERAPAPDDGIALSKILFEVAVRANRVTPITLPAVGCMALLGAAPRALTLPELQQAVVQLVQWAQARGVGLSSDFSPRRLAEVEKLVDAMIAMSLWTRHDEGGATVFGIEPAQHPAASYYRNTIVHLFVNKAIVELALLGAAEVPAAAAAGAFRSEAARLRDCFKFEFFYPGSADFMQQLEQEMQRVDRSWERRLAGGESEQLLREMPPLVAHACLQQFTEAYSVVFEVLARMPGSESMEESAGVSEALRGSRQAYLQQRITSEASIGKILFANAYRLAANQGLSQGQPGPGAEVVHAGRLRLLREFRELSTRLERVRSMARPASENS
jgi:glycerol-3-phosphate O-acyltransferase